MSECRTLRLSVLCGELNKFYAHLKKEGQLIRTDLYGKGLSDRMGRMCHAKCWAALDQAVQEILIRTNPAICQSGARRCRCCLTRNSIGFSCRPRRGYFELLLLDLSTGLRRGELLALQWSDLDLDAGTLSVTKQI